MQVRHAVHLPQAESILNGHSIVQMQSFYKKETHMSGGSNGELRRSGIQIETKRTSIGMHTWLKTFIDDDDDRRPFVEGNLLVASGSRRLRVGDIVILSKTGETRYHDRHCPIRLVPS